MDKILMAHGAGGELMNALIKDYILKYLGNESADIDVPLEALDDSGVIKDIALTTDSYVVKPIFYPGGDIGSLAVAGTVNDLAVIGAKPIALSTAFVIEEGFPLSDFETILASIRKTSQKAGVSIITGDTKVVEAGALDQIMINTGGMGIRSKSLAKNIAVIKRYRPFNSKWLLDSNIRVGDKIIISGSIAEHGITILSSREGYGFESKVQSDTAPLNKIIDKILNIGGIVAMKDPTRGGLANALNEFADKSKVGILIEEDKIPISEAVSSAAEFLGVEPLEIGNEGKLVIGVVKEKAEEVLQALRKTKEGKDAEIIGEARKDIRGVAMKTVVGGKRIVERPLGDPVPRIC
ncbi:MAG: hydrogenase expression/formation protein HypE [Candidatus Thermoplasmatota archaeon]|nr:hydrogenase expression/formation protein HypE [Candidatus Thermoplasmatota archaeon]